MDKRRKPPSKENKSGGSLPVDADGRMGFRKKSRFVAEANNRSSESKVKSFAAWGGRGTGLI